MENAVSANGRTRSALSINIRLGVDKYSFQSRIVSVLMFRPLWRHYEQGKLSNEFYLPFLCFFFRLVGQNKRIAPLSFPHGCCNAKGLTPEINCDQAMGLPPVTSTVFHIAHCGKMWVSRNI
jgi:hypothetical protein